HDATEILSGEAAEEPGRRRHGRGIERRNLRDAVHDHANPFSGDVYHHDARLGAHVDHGELEPPPQVHDGHHTSEVVHHTFDILGGIGHRCGRHVADHAFHCVHVGGEEILAEPEDDEL